MIRHAIKTLSTTTPLELTIEDSINGVNTFIVQNTNDADYVYIGNSNVSSSSYGFMLYPRQAFTAELRPSDRLYAVASSAVSVACMSIERST
jgi:hypothetical protein